MAFHKKLRNLLMDLTNIKLSEKYQLRGVNLKIGKLRKTM